MEEKVMTIYPDFTLLIQMANFLILLFLLNMFLYKPIRDILAKRNGEFEKLTRLIEEMRKQMEERQRRIEEALAQAKKLGATEKESLKEEAVKYEKELLTQTYKAVEQKLAKAKSELEKRLKSIKAELQKEVDLLSKELAERILGRRVNI